MELAPSQSLTQPSSAQKNLAVVKLWRETPRTRLKCPFGILSGWIIQETLAKNGLVSLARAITQRTHICYLVHKLLLLLFVPSGIPVLRTLICLPAVRSVKIGAVVGVLAIYFSGPLAADVVSVRKLLALSHLPVSTLILSSPC